MDWGDYTPGPWTEDHDWGDDGTGWLMVYHLREPSVNRRVAETYCSEDARLISKAYLIPRLEAALDYATRTLPEWAPADASNKPIEDLFVLLHELRSE